MLWARISGSPGSPQMTSANRGEHAGVTPAAALPPFRVGNHRRLECGRERWKSGRVVAGGSENIGARRPEALGATPAKTPGSGRLTCYPASSTIKLLAVRGLQPLLNRGSQGCHAGS
jgi:hypothetical protein